MKIRNNRQPTTIGGNGDSPTLQQILETMTELQRGNEEFRKRSKNREREREEAYTKQERMREEADRHIIRWRKL